MRCPKFSCHELALSFSHSNVKQNVFGPATAASIFIIRKLRHHCKRKYYRNEKIFEKHNKHGDCSINKSYVNKCRSELYICCIVICEKEIVYNEYRGYEFRTLVATDRIVVWKKKLFSNFVHRLAVKPNKFIFYFFVYVITNYQKGVYLFEQKTE